MKACPRCRQVSLEEGAGVVGEDVCSSCSGRFLSHELTERVIVEELGLDREALKEIASLFSGLRLPCPACTALMRPLRLRGVAVDLCFSCGGLWLDAGELQQLTMGRHEEPKKKAAPAAPVVVGREERSVVTLGRGNHVVFFSSLDDIDESVLRAVFARTDGLTDVDAQMLARHNHGVVVEGVAAEGAAGLVSVLRAHQLDAVAVTDAVLRLPPALQTSDVEVDATRLLARFHTGPPLEVLWSSVVAVVAGEVKRERLEQKRWQQEKRSDARRFAVADNEHEVVSSEDVVVEMLQIEPGRPARRLRVVPHPKPGSRGAAKNQPSIVTDFAVAAGVASGRGPASVGSTTWPKYRRPRELERELCWVAWRAARWPAT